MTYLILSFLTSALITLMMIRSADRHGRLSADHDFSGPQKFHARAVPRIGGIGIFVALVAGVSWTQWVMPQFGSWLWLMVVCTLPAFLAGLTEDLTKSVSPRRRLIATCTSAALAAWLLDGVLRETAIWGVDTLMVYPIFAVALTLLVVTGVANSVNIIDGFNGLASMCVLIMLLALAYVSYQVQDAQLMIATLITAGALLGFFVWNYPAGLIFLGDGGAYLVGFILAELNILLITRNSGVSPLFPLLLCAYPIFETIFTMYRRRVLKGVATGLPDGIHLHTLIYRRVVRLALPHEPPLTGKCSRTERNSMTSPYLWLLCLLCVIPALLWWNNTSVLTIFIGLFMVAYVLIYWSIVRFKVPKWLVLKR